jgi:hypothetical protein
MSHISIGSILPVGTIIHSMLTTAQFATQYGDNWVLADGRSVTGTLYASVTGNSIVPDMRGRFLRGKGSSNPDGDLALGTLTSDKIRSHTHVIPGCLNSGLSGTPTTSATGQSTRSDDRDTVATGGNETAPVSVTVNVFIRIN